MKFYVFASFTGLQQINCDIHRKCTKDLLHIFKMNDMTNDTHTTIRLQLKLMVRKFFDILFSFPQEH